MKTYIKAGLAVLLLIALGLFAVSKETSPPFVEMEVKGVRMDVLGQNPVVILADKEGKRALPIWIGLLEANAIERELKSVTTSRPMTHDLLHSILEQVRAKVKEVKIVDLKDHTYYAKLFLTLNKESIEIDARPSDAIIMALKSKAPVFVAAKIVEDQGVLLTRKEALENAMASESRNSLLRSLPTSTQGQKRSSCFRSCSGSALRLRELRLEILLRRFIERVREYSRI
jgi:bifunctional DNase/RNase